MNVTTLPKFAQYLQSLPESAAPLALALFEQFVNNPYVGVPFGGPTNPKGCELVIYKPNNPQYAVQGAVSSSARMLKLNVTTIEKNLAGYNRDQRIGAALGTQQKIFSGYGSPMVPFFYKNKSPYCTQDYFTNFVPRFQNKRTCATSGGRGSSMSSNITNPTKWSIRGGNVQSALPTNYFGFPQGVGDITA
jgi:hypothetical protein